MAGFAILLAFHLLGLWIQKGTSLPLPANVIGLILFTACLFLKIIKLEWVEESAQFLLKHMLLFFLPFVVGTMVYFREIRESWLAIIGGLLLSTLLSLAVTGWLTQWLERRETRHE
ncbi:Putative murein hydrolase exporter, LrgA [Thermobacillus xylanilyticus]|jgi:holin-like protein|uniref:Murein hydrolase exporter, LrgA n=1 Tax=Thermobacillus xylanilyticus TaxID=76633 RepID=A0ABM8V1C4_THEXY|nr:CidA/LrgA family protein [Thermobacillus xylanilyticus]CAG5080737.1 Putative murein hydrolase exporter, LrgA [Thermobacillus xylanilyticus]